MPLRLRRFTRPEILSSIRPDLLRRFLVPYQSFFHEQAFDLSCLDENAGAEALASLSGVLLNPAQEFPHALVDALFCIHEVAVPENADLLEITAASERIALEPESTLLEVALAIWMAVPEALKWMHRRQSTTRLRSFEYFSSEDGVSTDFSLNEERIRQLEHSLALYFEKRDRGYGCQIHHYPQEHEHWFLISHGERYKRKTTWEKGKLGTIGFRPEKYDLVIYDSLTEELRINAKTDAQREHYRKQFGFYLFGRENHFPGRNKYTLAPLLRDGEAALFSGDIPEIESVRLVELSYYLDDDSPEVRTHKANDVFAALARHRQEIPKNIRPLKATFRLTFRGHDRPRTVTIKPSNVALYTRDGDERIIQDWLNRREFIIPDKVKGHEQFEHILEVC
ncbi:hypothetical protein [Ruficoccus sp. ZRK36]|uniref:hypothetical protein n=1 Tax=Ruficoccus sp. ZRK36 TaxID=2866311 RepID=UPI001C72D93D|nr:hypothetical protein [Ruficoccus sp. ZRK36]QYY34640.1 hypothetical protein K0V07_10025 [Ruficoccus sp. ZRK36]